MPFVQFPACSRASSIIFVGMNGRGNWVAREQNGAFGGVFVNRDQAFKYALFENGYHPETIVEVSCELELDIPATPQMPAPGLWSDTSAQGGTVISLTFYVP